MEVIKEVNLRLAKCCVSCRSYHEKTYKIAKKMPGDIFLSFVRLEHPQDWCLEHDIEVDKSFVCDHFKMRQAFEECPRVIIRYCVVEEDED